MPLYYNGLYSFVKSFLRSSFSLACLHCLRYNCVMVNEVTTQNDFPDHDRVCILKALRYYYREGLSYEDAFDKLENYSYTTFWRRKKEYPDVVGALEKQAQKEALARVEGDQAVFLARQKAKSREVQREALDALENSVPTLALIASGKSFIVETDDGERVIMSYPRDIVKAAQVLQDIARHGAIPLDDEYTREIVGARSVTELPSIPASFSSVTIENKDGSSLTMSVKDSTDIIEGEIVED